VSETYTFSADLWEWEGKAAWFFVTLPFELSAEIREVPRMPRGFGSVRVSATIGGSTWQTSIFPDSKVKRYILPVKKAVRVAESINVHETVEVSLELLEQD
jgi:Domain of unknown function (DUF1905)